METLHLYKGIHFFDKQLYKNIIFVKILKIEL